MIIGSPPLWSGYTRTMDRWYLAIPERYLVCIASAKLSQPYLGETAFGIHREVAAHHPVIVAGLDVKYIFYPAAFVFAKVKYDLPLVIEDHTPRKVYHVTGSEVME